MDGIKILIADDFESVREGIRNLLEVYSDIEIVGEAADGREAVRLAQELKPDVVLMDVSMPELDGLEATAELKKTAPEIKVIALTRHTDPSYQQKMLKAGAAGFVQKQNVITDLARTIFSIAESNGHLDATIYTESAENSDGKSAQTTDGDGNLTEAEREILRRVAAGFSNQEIAALLGQPIENVEILKTNALEKLGISRRNDLARYAAAQGWLEEN